MTIHSFISAKITTVKSSVGFPERKSHRGLQRWRGVFCLLASTRGSQRLIQTWATKITTHTSWTALMIAGCIKKILRSSSLTTIAQAIARTNSPRVPTLTQATLAPNLPRPLGILRIRRTTNPCEWLKMDLRKCKNTCRSSYRPSQTYHLLATITTVPRHALGVRYFSEILRR